MSPDQRLCTCSRCTRIVLKTGRSSLAYSNASYFVLMIARNTFSISDETCKIMKAASQMELSRHRWSVTTNSKASNNSNALQRASSWIARANNHSGLNNIYECLLLIVRSSLWMVFELCALRITDRESPIQSFRNLQSIWLLSPQLGSPLRITSMTIDACISQNFPTCKIAQSARLSTSALDTYKSHNNCKIPAVKKPKVKSNNTQIVSFG